jgi:hypothetical protein
VLQGTDNHRGITTRLRYAPSTRFFLEDRARGRPWLTPLPFPVQVLQKVETIDHISGNKHVSTYRYHHGYYDGRERAFMGFGRVDQFDSETFADFARPDLHGDDSPFGNASPAHHMPPVETRTWYHTGCTSTAWVPDAWTTGIWPSASGRSSMPSTPGRRPCPPHRGDR